MTREDLVYQLMQLELEVPLDQKWRQKRLQLTRAEARVVVNAFFDAMAGALRRGESVELPFGQLEVFAHEVKPRRGWFLDRVRVTYRKPKSIRLITEGVELEQQEL
jgi:nucleoid DNA-binding protein